MSKNIISIDLFDLSGWTDHDYKQAEEYFEKLSQRLKNREIISTGGDYKLSVFSSDRPI